MEWQGTPPEMRNALLRAPLFYKVCFNKLSSGNQVVAMSQTALIPDTWLVTTPL